VSDRPPATTRADYRWFIEIPTRWHDNDVYQHVNNVIYYAFFDTAVGRFLVESGVLDIRHSPVIGYVAETKCQFLGAVAFPDRVTVGLRAGRIGTTSVRYEIGIFRNEDETAAAQGHFVHVYVERETGRPTPLPPKLRAALQPLRVDAGASAREEKVPAEEGGAEGRHILSGTRSPELGEPGGHGDGEFGERRG